MSDSESFSLSSSPLPSSSSSFSFSSSSSSSSSSNITEPSVVCDFPPCDFGYDYGLISYGVLCVILVFCFTLYIIRHFSPTRSPLIVSFVVFIGWSMTFSICFLVPIDLIPSAHVGNDLQVVWTVLYWTTQLLSWLVCPLLSGYYDNGGFNAKQRILLSLRYNLLLFGAAGGVFILGIIYLRAAAQMSWNDISGLMVCMSTVVGLVLLIMFSGFGLVELPRSIWNSSNVARRLDFIYYSAASVCHERDDIADELSATALLVKSIEAKVLQSDEDIRSAYLYITRTLSSIESSPTMAFARRAHPFDLPLAEEFQKKEYLTMNLMIKLNYHLRILVHHLQSVDSQWNDYVTEALEIQGDTEETLPDLEALTASPSSSFISASSPSSSPSFGERLRKLWRRKLKRVILRILFVFFTLLSILILFCEMTIVSDKNISPLGQIIKAVSSSPTSVQIFSVIPLTYLSACCYYPLFQLRLSQVYYMSSHRSSEDSLLTNVTFLLRVSAPLAYNFVLLLRIDSTALQTLIGRINVIPFFGRSFTEIFPIFIAVISFLFLFNIPSYVLSCLNIQNFKYLPSQNIGQTQSKSLGAKRKGGEPNSRVRIINAKSKSSDSHSSDSKYSKYNYNYDADGADERTEYEEDIADQIAEGRNLINAEKRKLNINRQKEEISRNTHHGIPTHSHSQSDSALMSSASFSSPSSSSSSSFSSSSMSSDSSIDSIKSRLEIQKQQARERRDKDSLNNFNNNSRSGSFRTNERNKLMDDF